MPSQLQYQMSTVQPEVIEQVDSSNQVQLNGLLDHEQPEVELQLDSSPKEEQEAVSYVQPLCHWHIHWSPLYAEQSYPVNQLHPP